MSQIEKTSQIDALLDQIDQKAESNNKKRIFLLIGLLILSAVAFFVYSSFFSQKAELAVSSDIANNSEPIAETIIPISTDEDIEDDNTLLADDTEDRAIEEENTEEIPEEAPKKVEKKAETKTEKKVDNKKSNNSKSSNTTTKASSANTNNTGSGVSNRSFSREEVANIPTAKTFNEKGGSSSPKKVETAVNTPPKKKAEDKKVEKPEEKKTETAKEEVTASQPKEKEIAEEAPKPAKPTAAKKKVSKAPSYPGGEARMRNFFARKISYPSKAISKKVEGSVSVRIKVDEKGKIVESSIVKGIGSGCDREVLRAINKMPKWEPGTDDGVPVAKYYMLSVAFRLPK